MDVSICQAYNDLLARPPDSKGLQFYREFMKANNNNIDKLKKHIMNSDEYKKHDNSKMFLLEHKHVKPRNELFTVLITNWKRPEFLWKCLMSVIRNNIQNICISSFEGDRELLEVVSKTFPYIKIHYLPIDLGCNKLWLNGLYMVNTPYVLILHDDDELTPSFSNYKEKIDECLRAQTCLVLWDGIINHNGRVIDEYHTNMPKKYSLKQETGAYSAHDLLKHYKECVYPLSPVVQIMQTKVCIKALLECQNNFVTPKFFTKPTMMIGNEITMTYRNLEEGIHRGSMMLYIHDALTYYGRHDGSESESHVLKKSDTLRLSYEHARKYLHGPKTPFSKGNIIHVVNIFEPNVPNDKRRHVLAMKTWDEVYMRNSMSPHFIYDDEFDRNSSHVGDSKKIPFVKDIIESAARHLTDIDLVCFTNSDICISELCEGKIRNVVNKYGCGFSFRRDYDGKLMKKVNDSDIKKLRWYVGSDLFVFTVKWWKAHRDKFPDFILGKPCWDWVLRCLMGYTVLGTNVFNSTLQEHGNVCEIQNIIYHEKHESYAEKPNIYKKDLANLWNWKMAKCWFDEYAKNTHVDGLDIFNDLDFEQVSTWFKYKINH